VSPGRRDGARGAAEAQGRQVNLGQAAIGEVHVHFDKELAAGERAGLCKPRLGQHGGGDGDPGEALRFGEGTPAFGNGAEDAADGLLGRGAGVGRDEGGIADLAIAVALPDHVAAFARLGAGPLHRQDAPPGAWRSQADAFLAAGAWNKCPP